MEQMTSGWHSGSVAYAFFLIWSGLRKAFMHPAMYFPLYLLTPAGFLFVTYICHTVLYILAQILPLLSFCLCFPSMISHGLGLKPCLQKNEDPLDLIL